MAEWIVVRSGKEHGPLTSQQLKGLARSGRLRPDDQVRRDDATALHRAGDVTGLFSASVADNGSKVLPPPVHFQHQSNETDSGLVRQTFANPAGAAGSTVDAPGNSPTPPILPTDDLLEAPPATDSPSLSSADRLGQLAERLYSMAKGNVQELFATAKQAKALGTLHARKTHLARVTLPNAYLALGREAYSSGKYKDEFPDLFRRIDEVEREIAAAESAPATPRPKDMRAKIRADASRLKSKGQAAISSLRRDSILRELGRAVYGAHHQSDAADEGFSAIADCQTRVETLDSQIRQVASEGPGPFSQRTSVIAAAVLLFFPVGLYLIWKHPLWSAGLKRRWSGATCGLVGLVLVVGMMRPESVPPAASSSPDASAVEQSGSGASPFSASELEAISKDVRLQVAQEVGNLNSDNLASYLEVKATLKNAGPGVNSEGMLNSVFFSLIPSGEWPEAARRLGFSREEYERYIKLFFWRFGEEVSRNHDAANAMLQKLTGERFEDYAEADGGPRSIETAADGSPGRGPVYLVLTEEERRQGWDTPETSPGPPPAPPVSAEKFNGLRTTDVLGHPGMDRFEVVEYLGGRAHKRLFEAGSRADGITWYTQETQVYAGETPGSVIVLMFEDRRLMSKRQRGL